MTGLYAANGNSTDYDTDDVGETATQVRRQLADLGWTCEGKDPRTKAWRFRGPGRQTLVVPAHSEIAALRAVWRQLTQHPLTSILRPEPS
jgi:hypothetical protein